MRLKQAWFSLRNSMPDRLRSHRRIQVGSAPNLDEGPKSQTTGAAQARAACARLEEIGSLHRYAADTFAASLACIETLSRAPLRGSGLTPRLRAALGELRQAYLWAILTAVNKAGITIVEQASRESAFPHPSAGQQQIDQISQMYIQHARTILRRNA